MEERANVRRKWLWLAGGLLVAFGVAVAAVLLSRSGDATPQSGEKATAFIGDLASSATASGRVQAGREASLALTGGGRVEAVIVEIGNLVEAGEALLILEGDALQRAVLQAEEALAIQEANLESLEAGATAAEVKAAQAAVASAELALEALLAGPTDEEIAQTEANLRAAQANVAAASNRLGETQANPDEAALLQVQQRVADAEQAVLEAERAHQRMLDCEQLESGEWDCETLDLPFMSAEDEAAQIRLLELRVVQARESLAAAQADLQSVQQGASQNTVAVSQANVASMAAQRDAAQAQLDLLLAGPTEVEVASARSALASAESNLARLLAGATEAQLVSAEAAVEQARIALQRAQNSLEEAVLRAPFAGMVTAVYASAGEVASGIVIDLVDMSSLEVVLDVDEMDVGTMTRGQPATITLEAWPDEEIDSEIVAISPAANSLVLDTSIATYPVHLTLAQSDLPVRLGMTANARLLTARRENVLLVPNRAVTADRAAGLYYVNLVETGADGEETVTPVEVAIGLRDDQYTEITGGLQEGDVVQIGPVVLPGNDLFDGQGGGPFGG